MNGILSLKNFIEKSCPTYKVILPNVIYQSENVKASLTFKNVNDHLDALNIEVVDNRNIGGNCLNNSEFVKKWRFSVKIDGPSALFVVVQTTMRSLLTK